ncbi:hypothetical protein FOA52_002375 [Chlamydomonas sp. UWO 241]|nr:hypothetical protein FOA52_002375 [Chlamydomonas sp. UWO 241]
MEPPDEIQQAPSSLLDAVLMSPFIGVGIGSRRVAFNAGQSPDDQGSPITPVAFSPLISMAMTDASGAQEGGSLRRTVHGPSILATSTWGPQAGNLLFAVPLRPRQGPPPVHQRACGHSR